MLIVLKIFQIWETEEGKAEKVEKRRKQRGEKTGRNTSVRKDSIEAPRRRPVIVKTDYNHSRWQF